MIFKHSWIELRRLRPDYVLGKLHHFGRKLHLRNFAEIMF